MFEIRLLQVFGVQHTGAKNNGIKRQNRGGACDKELSRAAIFLPHYFRGEWKLSSQWWITSIEAGNQRISLPTY